MLEPAASLVGGQSLWARHNESVAAITMHNIRRSFRMDAALPHQMI